MKKQIFFLTFLLLAATRGQAQDTPHEINLMLGGGLSGLKYSVNEGKNNINFAIQGGLGYTYFINSNFAVVTGLEYGMYNSTGVLNDRTVSTTGLRDEDRTSPAYPNGEPFTYNVKTTGYEEKQKIGMLNIPIMGQYRRELVDDIQLYVQAGLRLGFPMSATNSAEAQQLSIKAHYDQSNVDLPEDGAQYRGLGVYDDWTSDKQDLKLNMAYSICLETGLNYALSTDWKVYGGLYFDYGLNSLVKNKANIETMVPYNPQSSGAPEVNPIMDLKTTGDAKIISFGMRLRIAFAPTIGGRGGSRRRW